MTGAGGLTRAGQLTRAGLTRAGLARAGLTRAGLTRAGRWCLALTVGLAAATAAGGLAAGPAAADPGGEVRIMPLGDSITRGWAAGGYRTRLWQRLIAAGYPVDFVGSQQAGPTGLGDRDHEGHPGWRIDHLDARIPGWLAASRPRAVLLHVGTNDILQNADLGQAPARLSALIESITRAAPWTEVFIATVIPMPYRGYDSKVRAYNAAIPAIVARHAWLGRRVHLVAMYPALTSDDLADGIHPNATGYRKMAAVWYRALRSVPGVLPPAG